MDDNLRENADAQPPAVIAPDALAEAVAQLKEELMDELITRMKTPAVQSTRYKITLYLMLMTSIITIAVMAMAAYKIEVPEIATGVILMGTFNALLAALASYFDSRKQTDVTNILTRQ